MSIPQPVLDAKLLTKFQAALSPDMIDYLVAATNEMLRELHGTTPQEIDALTRERREVERQLSNLVEFVAKGDVSSPRLRDEIRAREHRLAELDQQLDGLRGAARPVAKQIDRTWVEAQAQNLSELLIRDPVGARRPCVYNWLRGLDIHNATRSLRPTGSTCAEAENTGSNPQRDLVARRVSLPAVRRGRHGGLATMPGGGEALPSSLRGACS
jgi:septal ring factor EnvC (AmiA/AmiB activator)